MSTDQDDRGAPSNAKLAERTARIEEQVGHVAETVERIEERVVDDQDELAERVDDAEEKVETVYTYHQAVRYGLPILGAVGSFLGGVVAFVTF